MPDFGGYLSPGTVGASVSSGELTSGSVYGFFGPTRLIASGTVGSFDFASGGITSGYLATCAVSSGNICSGQVGWPHLSSGCVRSGHVGDAAVNSGNIGSGQIGTEHIADGLVIQVDIGSGAVGSGALASGTVSRFHMASGAINSGHVGSGAIQGFFGATRHIASGTVGQMDFGSGAVVSGHAGSGSIVGAAGGGFRCVASGTLGTNDYGSGSVVSGTIASGTISRFHMASGAINSGQVGSGAVLGQNAGGAFCIASGSINFQDIADAGIGSGNISSGHIAWPHLSSGCIRSGHVASGAVTGQAGGGAFCVASGTVARFDLGSGSVWSGHVTSGGIWGLVGSLPHIASGSMTGFELGSGAIVSGRVASGQLGNFHFASGTKVDVSEWTYDDNFTAGEILSGASTGIAVAFTQSGILQTAMASVSGRMPAVGVVTANVASGGTVTMYRGGRLFNAAFNFSGWMNRPVYVGRSGQLSASGAPTSSGDIQQVMGISCNQSGLQVQIGDALEEVVAASGDVGSGSITGQGAAGYFCVASGSLNHYDLASGTTVPRAQNVTPIFSGGLWNSGFITSETISGVRAVCIDLSLGLSSGALRIAMAAVSGRWPAIGIVKDNVLSGLQCNVYTDGLILFTSGLGEFSGYQGTRLWLGRSGAVVPISGGPNSGGFASGDVGQPLGMVAGYQSGMASGSFALLNVHLVYWSGGPLGIAAGGPF